MNYSWEPRIGDLKWFEPKTICPLIAVRTARNASRAWFGHVDRGRCDLPVTRRQVRLRP